MTRIAQPSRSLSTRRWLLAGVSTIGLLATGSPAYAGGSLQDALARAGAANAAAQAQAAAGAQAVQSNAALQQANRSLAQALSTLNSQRAAQASAAAAARAAASAIPNGLAVGGLNPAGGAAISGDGNGIDLSGASGDAWTGVSSVTQSVAGGKTTVDVHQSQQKAILTWDTFNVGRDTILNFDQADSSYIALNRVVGAAAAPSEILGSVNAKGSVYVLNQNGIIFGAGSQVNVHSLIASSLNLFDNDLAKSNARFLSGGIGDLTAANGLASTSPDGLAHSILLITDSADRGDVVVEKGATITGGPSGLVLLAAPDVTNRGIVQTGAGGQVAMVAGIGVSYDYNRTSFDPRGVIVDGTTYAQFTADDSTTFLRFANYGKLTDGFGNDITPIGILTNDADAVIYAPTGNVTLLGGAIRQNGTVITTTSVSRPGSIVMTAAYEVGVNGGARSPADEYSGPLQFYTGAVEFGAGAVTSVLPDSGSETTLYGSSKSSFGVSPSFAVDFTTKLPTEGLGMIDVIGQTIDFKSGSLTYAPGQYVGANAVVLPDPRLGSLPGAGRVYLETGATVDVSGLADVQVPNSSSIVTVKLGGNELADTPLQRNGILYGQEVTVDLNLSGTRDDGSTWVGTPLANLTDYLNLVQLSVNQLLTNAGTVSFKGGEVILAAGSTVNVTGGYTRNLGGVVKTTRLKGADGRYYDIGSADPDMTYVGISGLVSVRHPRWGVTETYRGWDGDWTGRYVPEYLAGGSGGHLDLRTAGALIAEGTVLADAVSGTRQVASGQIPSNGTLSIVSTGYGFELGTAGTLSATGSAALTLPAGFSPSDGLLADAPGYSTNALDTDKLNGSHYSAISINAVNAGPMVVDEGATLLVEKGGSIDLQGTTVAIGGTLSARSGSISVTADPRNSTATDIAEPRGGNITVGSGAVLDVSGVFTNDMGQAVTSSGAKYIDGGAITLATVAATKSGVDYTGNIIIADGAVLDASSGAYVGPDGKAKTTSSGLLAGRGGSVALIAYKGVSVPLPDVDPTAPHGRISIGEGAVITGLGFSGGGTVTVQTLSAQVGSDNSTMADYGYYFDPTYWGDRGFGSFVVNAARDVTIPDGTTVVLTHKNLVADAVNPEILFDLTSLSTGARLREVVSSGLLSEWYRSPTNLSVTAGLQMSGYTMETSWYQPATIYGSNAAYLGTGAKIIGDAGAQISLASNTQTVVLGGIVAHGGEVDLSVPWAMTNAPAVAGSLYLGPDSVIDVSGTIVRNDQARPVWTSDGLVTPAVGRIYDGGAVKLASSWAPIVAAPGSIINVSGTSGAYDVKVTDSAAGTVRYARQQVWSDGGTIAITGSAALLFESTLIGNAGGAGDGAALTIVQDNAGASAYGLPKSLVLVDGLANALAAAGITFDFSTYGPFDSSNYQTMLGTNFYQAYLGGNYSNGLMIFDVGVLDHSGFTSLKLNSASTIAYTGDVAVSLGKSFEAYAPRYAALANARMGYGDSVSAGMLWTNADTTPTLSVTAPYINLSGPTITPSATYSLGQFDRFDSYGAAALNLDASALLDVSGSAMLFNIASTRLASAGDLRLLPESTAASGNAMLIGSLVTDGDVAMTAGRVYPATDTAFIVMAKGDVVFGYPSGVGANPATPLSVGGALVVDAANIVQGGNIVAPYGSILLGFGPDQLAYLDLDAAVGKLLNQTPFAATNYGLSGALTTSVTLAAGSVTSVSSNGALLPYGVTVDGTDWSYGGRTISSPPTGLVSLDGASVSASPGAVLDLSGGGDIYAQEWVPGTGGSRDVLSRLNVIYTGGSTTPTQTPLYPDGRQIYAIVPGLADISVYDAALANDSAIAVGTAIHLDGSTGLPAGVYTLLPAKYATLPGAYRVVINTDVTAAADRQASHALPDGTQVVTGYLVDSLTGASNSTRKEFYVQSASVWGQYSEYQISSANRFFTARAAADGLATPYLPVDAARLVLAAGSQITLAPGVVRDAVGSFPAANGQTVVGTGLRLDISGSYIEINDTGVSDTAGYNAISSETLAAIGAESILIGGTRTITDNGLLVSPTAYGVIIANDADHPLEASEVMLVARPTVSGANTVSLTLDGLGDAMTVALPDAGTGTVEVRSGSVLRATGASRTKYDRILLGVDLATLPDLSGTYSVSALRDTTVADNLQSVIATYYNDATAALAGFVRVSNGSQVSVQTPTQAQLDPHISVVDDTSGTANKPVVYALGAIPLAGSVTIENGASVGSATTNAVGVVSMADTHVDAGANLDARNILLVGDSLVVAGANVYGGTGLVVGAQTLANLLNAESAVLQSLGGFTFVGDQDIAMTAEHASLTLDGAVLAGSGTVALRAPTLVLANSFGATGTFSSGSGAISLTAGELDFAGGDKTLSGFGAVSVTASRGIVGKGDGSMDFGSLDLALVTPVVIADTGSTQVVKTTGALSVAAPAAGGSALTSAALGGAITLQGGSVSVAVPVQALAGNITLTATGGDVSLAGTGRLIAHGVAKTYVDTVRYAPGGAVTLEATGGTVEVTSGAVIDFAGAALGGDAGGLAVTASGTAPVRLDGTILGSAAAGYSGGSLSIDSVAALDLDRLADLAVGAGITKNVLLHTRTGDLTLSAGKSLRAFSVDLVADGGVVAVDGLIDASGTAGAVNKARQAGGTIQLWGKDGVTVNGRLLATSAAADQLGGTIMVGTSATYNAVNGTNAQYGYENITAADSGAIVFGANALVDVSGGTVDGVSGGKILIRAPLLQDGTVRVSVASSGSFRGATTRGVTVEEYATWSTSDATSGTTHFDGIVDPAGWYDSAGRLQPGTFKNSDGTAVATWDGGNLSQEQLADYLSRYYFTPSSYNDDHRTFYGWTGGDDANANDPGTLMGFIRNANLAAVANVTGVAGFTQAVGVDLVNPADSGVNGGAISVLTNWNLGATDAAGNAVFRHDGNAPFLSLRAGGDLIVKASISDGFRQNGPGLTAAITPTGGGSTYNTYNDFFGSGAQSPTYSMYQDGTYLTDNLQNITGTSFQLLSPVADWGSIGVSSADTQDQYYSMYRMYLSTYNSYYYGTGTRGLLYVSNHNAYSSGGVTLAADAASGSSTASLAQNVLNAWDSANTAFAAATNYATYFTSSNSNSYVMKYRTYVTAYTNWVAAVLADSSTVATLLNAPLAPTAVSIPSYSRPTPVTALNLSNAPDVVASVGNAAPIASMTVAAGVSSSYRLVAGAAVASASPMAVDGSSAADVTVDAHIQALVLPDSQMGLRASNSGAGVLIAMPTTVRTGTGSIDVAAPDDLTLDDPIAPGVIYTAGTVATTSATPASIAYGAGAYHQTYGAGGISTIVTSGVNPSGAGAITVTVGGDIAQRENIIDMLSQPIDTNYPTGVTSAPGAFVGQLWTAWLLKDASSAWYVNFGSFDQGIMSVGGNVTVKAGGDIRDLSVSLPTTGSVVNGALVVTGGGNLAVEAGGDIFSGSYYVGRGTGTVAAGGTIAADLTRGAGESAYQVGTLLGIQYGGIDLSARTSAEIGGVFNPTYLFDASIYAATPVASYSDASTSTSLVPYVTSLSTDSFVRIHAVGGDLAFNTLQSQIDVFSLGRYASGAATVSSALLPSSLDLTAYSGGISVQHGGGLYPSSTGTLTILAEKAIALSVPTGLLASDVLSWSPGNVSVWSLGKLSYPVGTGILPTAVAPALVSVNSLGSKLTSDPALIVSDADPIRVYSLSGDIVNGTVIPENMIVSPISLTGGSSYGGLMLITNAPAEIYAGGDIVDLALYGTNFTAADVTSVVAGGDIRYRSPWSTYGASPILELAGPGSLIVQAGGDIEFPSQRNWTYRFGTLTNKAETGIRTIGNSEDDAAIPLTLFRDFGSVGTFGTFGNPYLSDTGASVTVLAGVGKGVDYAGFAAAYLNPATATSQDGLTSFATILGAASPEQAWADYQTLSPMRQQIVARKVFLAILDATGKDYNDTTSPSYHQYGRGYQAINTLFPAAYGYTANGLDGGENGASSLVSTGSIDMRGSTIQTQRGGDIAILAPGGRILVGSSGASPAVDPASEGIITLEQGDIATFTDTDVLVAQSRIFTEQGGDILMWSSNGDLNAGKGAKTSVSFPPPVYQCDLGWYCTVDVKGAVTGAGIATLQSLPGVPAGDANLVAPRGTVDAGAAGIRASGNLNVAALHVLNAFNIQVQGVSSGIPMAAAPNLGALNAASSVAGQAAGAADEAARQSRQTGPRHSDMPSIITVEVIGYGGAGADEGSLQQQRRQDEERQRRLREQRSQNPDSSVQVVGAGNLTSQQRRILTDREERNLVQ